MEGEKIKELKNLAWSGLGKLGTKGVAFAFSVFLARLLSPDDFGLSGMIAIFIALAGLFSDCGFSAAIIRKTDRDERDYATVFWFQLAVSLVCFGILFAMAPLIAAFFGRQELVGVTRLVAVNVVLGALAAVPYTKLRIAGNFRMLSVLDVMTAVASGAVGLVLAARGLGVWAIVWQGLAYNAVRTILLFAVTRWRPVAVFSRESFSSFFSFGWRQMLASLVNTTHSNLHALLIGRAFGAAETGLYNRAHYYAHEPGWLVQGMFSEVGYPALAKAAGDRRLLHRRFLQGAAAEALVMFVGLGILALFAHEIIEFLIGSQWLPCVPYVRILAVGAAFEPLRTFAQLPLYVDGRTDLVLKLELIETALGVGLVFLALPFGIAAVCWSKSIYHVVGLVINGGVLWKRFR